MKISIFDRNRKNTKSQGQKKRRRFLMHFFSLISWINKSFSFQMFPFSAACSGFPISKILHFAELIWKSMATLIFIFFFFFRSHETFLLFHDQRSRFFKVACREKKSINVRVNLQINALISLFISAFCLIRCPFVLLKQIVLFVEFKRNKIWMISESNMIFCGLKVRIPIINWWSCDDVFFFL
jgi:hypothetical protein